MLDKMIEVGLLFDFYGKLLTPRQQETLTLYYYEDLSLGEISERLEISRQGVFDHIHRGEDLLRDYEEKLGLVSRYSTLKNEIDNLNDYIKGIVLENNIREELEKRIGKLKKRL